MGFLSDVTDIAAIALTADTVWEKLNADRICVLEVWKHTDHTLRVASTAHAHGGFAVPRRSSCRPTR